jgi:hypothetical protein
MASGYAMQSNAKQCKAMQSNANKNLTYVRTEIIEIIERSGNPPINGSGQ